MKLTRRIFVQMSLGFVIAGALVKDFTSWLPPARQPSIMFYVV